MTSTMPELNANELAILKVVWQCGAQSAREVHDAVSTERGWSYSTTRTVMERMCQKGLLTKKAFHGLNLYEAAISKSRGLAGLIRRFADQVLECEPTAVASLFSQSEVLNEREIGELKALLSEPSEEDPPCKA